MKALVINFWVLSVATISVCQTLAPGRSDNWLVIAEECKKKTNANDGDIKSVINKEVPKTREAACFLACTKKAIGAMSSDNKINMTVVLSAFTPLKASDKDMYEKTVKIFQQCKALEIPETDECEAAKKFSVCVIPKRDALLEDSA